MNAKKEIDPIPPKSLDLSAQINTIEAAAAVAREAVAAAEARMIEASPDDVAYDAAREQYGVAHRQLTEIRARLEATLKRQAQAFAADYVQLRDWHQRRADGLAAIFEETRRTVAEERAEEMNRHNSVLAVLDHREGMARMAAAESDKHATQVFRVEDAVAVRSAAEAARRLDQLSADPALLALFIKRSEIHARVAALCALPSNSTERSEEIAELKLQRDAVDAEWQAAHAEHSKARRMVEAAISVVA